METNTIKTITKHKKPEYVVQPYEISRSCHRMTTTSRRIISMAMAYILPDMTDRTAVIDVQTFRDALDLDRGGEEDRILSQAVDQCFGQIITVPTADGWRKFTWIASAEFSKKNKLIKIKMSDELCDYLLSIKHIYSVIQLADFGQLQSFYALRYFELAKSYESLSGKNGNKKGEWFFTRSIPDIRQLMGINKSEYILNADLKRRVIEEPIKELNASNLGITIDVTYLRRSRAIDGVYFTCHNTAAPRRPRKPAAAPASKPIAEGAAERRQLMERYPAEYATWLAYYSGPGAAELPPAPDGLAALGRLEADMTVIDRLRSLAAAEAGRGPTAKAALASLRADLERCRAASAEATAAPDEPRDMRAELADVLSRTLARSRTAVADAEADIAAETALGRS